MKITTGSILNTEKSFLNSHTEFNTTHREIHNTTTRYLHSKPKWENQLSVGFRRSFIYQQMCRLQYLLALWYILSLHMGIWAAIPLNRSQRTPYPLWCMNKLENGSAGGSAGKPGVPNSSASPKPSICKFP
jgi:hypothetical protein